MTAPIRACRVCGCTENKACAGGCCWAGDDICSNCDPDCQRRRTLLLQAIRFASFAIGAMGDLSEDPVVFQRRHPVVDDEMIFDNAVDQLIHALQFMLEAAPETPATKPLLLAMAAFYEGDGPSDAPKGSPA